jgi:hypothetical protein
VTVSVPVVSVVPMCPPVGTEQPITGLLVFVLGTLANHLGHESPGVSKPPEIRNWGGGGGGWHRRKRQQVNKEHTSDECV